jgi:hypothetical protein
MISLKKIYTIERLSIIILILPYFIYNWISIKNSFYFKGIYIIYFFIILIIVEITLNYLLSFTNNKKISNFILFFIIIFFYGFYITNLIHSSFSKFLGIYIRGRFIFYILIPISYFLLININKKSYKFLNTFFLLFIIINFFYLKKSNKPNISINNNFKKLDNQFVTNKPVILIICDMYSSPDELYKIYKDSPSIYSFSNKLKLNKWIVNNNFLSYESETIHSLSSLFNFNLSKINELHKISSVELANNYLLKADIYDSLKNKKIEIINFGIFDIGNSKPINQLYYYQKNIYDVFLQNTIYYQIRFNTLNFNKKGINNNFYPTEFHNKFIIENLADSLAKLNNPNSFIYVHLWMPHPPFIYSPNFELKDINTKNYKLFWDFTNLKMDSLLFKLTRSNKYRIIFSGDHGYRNDTTINPYKTFTAFYGYEKNMLNEVKSVQDLGILINSSFK